MEMIYNAREKRLAEIRRYFFIENLKKIINIAAAVILVVGLIDLLIVMMTMLQVASGVDTPSIPFWTKQVEFFVRIMESV